MQAQLCQYQITNVQLLFKAEGRLEFVLFFEF